MRAIGSSALEPSPVEILRQIGRPGDVERFVSECRRDLQASLSAVERSIQGDLPLLETRRALHSLQNALRNCGQASSARQLSDRCCEVESGVLLREHVPAMRSAVEDAIADLSRLA